MNELVVLIPAGEVEEYDVILVPLTVPPTRVTVWKVRDPDLIDKVELSLMEGDSSWRCVLKKTDLLQVIR